MSDDVKHEMYREDGPDMADEFIPLQLYKEQEMVLAECFSLIMQSGLLDQLSPQSRDHLSESAMIQQFIKAGEGPNLDLRLTITEYRQHLSRMLEVPPAQFDFLNFIIKTCYLMMMAEKNPLIAQELRGVTLVSDALKGIVQ